MTGRRRGRDARVQDTPTERQDAPALRSLWAQPLWLHSIALLAVLLGGLALTRPFVAYSSDEGAALLQARQLERGEGWLYRSPIADIDPEDQARPFVRGDRGSNGVAPYAKHPLYPVVLAGADTAGGQLGLQLLGVAATLAAALLCALLARRIDPRHDRTALWLLGVGSPLFFDSYILLAHGLAAAAAGGALLLAFVATRREAPAKVVVAALVGVATAVAVGAMLRTEVLLLGPALAAVAAGLVLAKRMDPSRGIGLAVAAVAGSVGAYLTDRLWYEAIIGAPLPGVPNAQPSSWLAGRVDATHLTWFSPSRFSPPVLDAALVLALFLFAGAGLLAHRGPARERIVVLLATMAGACYMLRLLGSEPDLIPGLAVAFPAGWFLVWACGRRAIEGVRVPLLLGSSAVGAVAVLFTQYSIGGGVEWGGRYFAFLLPLIGAGAVVAAAPVVERLTAGAVRAVVAVLTVTSMLVAVMAILTIRSTHEATARLLDGIAEAAVSAGAADGFDRPVVISTSRLLPQIAYRDFEDYVWVVPDAENLSLSVGRLADSGVDRAVLAAADADAQVATLPDWSIVESFPDLAQDVVVIARR